MTKLTPSQRQTSPHICQERLGPRWLTQASGRARGEPVPFRSRRSHMPMRAPSLKARWGEISELRMSRLDLLAVQAQVEAHRLGEIPWLANLCHDLVREHLVIAANSRPPGATHGTATFTKDPQH